MFSKLNKMLFTILMRWYNSSVKKIEFSVLHVSVAATVMTPLLYHSTANEPLDGRHLCSLSNWRRKAFKCPHILDTRICIRCGSLRTIFLIFLFTSSSSRFSQKRFCAQFYQELPDSPRKYLLRRWFIAARTPHGCKNTRIS